MAKKSTKAENLIFPVAESDGTETPNTGTVEFNVSAPGSPFGVGVSNPDEMSAIAVHNSTGVVNISNENSNYLITRADPIKKELAKENITDQLISKLKQDYLPLKINGVEDKQGYVAVSNARKEVKRWRGIAQKICDAGMVPLKEEIERWKSKREELVKEEYHKIMSTVPDGQPVPDVLMNVMGANDRLVFRLKNLLAKRFPPYTPPRYKKKLK